MPKRSANSNNPVVAKHFEIAAYNLAKFLTNYEMKYGFFRVAGENRVPEFLDSQWLKYRVARSRNSDAT